MSEQTAAGSPAPPGHKPSWRDALRGNVLAMGLVSYFTDFSSEMIYPLLPVFISGLAPAAAAVYVGLMEGVAETTASLLKIFSGRVSDRLGKRKVLVLAGYGVSTLCRPLMAVAAAAWNVILLRFFDRIGKGVRTSPRDALIGDSVGPEYRGLAFSFHRAMDHAGAVTGPLAAALILLAMVGTVTMYSKDQAPSPGEMGAMRRLFLIALGPGLVAMAALALKVREIAPRPSPGAGPGGETGRLGLPRRFYYFVVVVTLFALGNSSDLFLLLYGKVKFGLSILEILALWVVLHLSKIAFSFPGGILSDRLGRRPLILAGWAVYALVYLGMAEVREVWQLWALFVAYGVYYGLTEGAEKALVTDFVPSASRGTAFGIYHGAIGLAALPASVLFGAVWVWVDQAYPGMGPRVAFGIGAGLAALAAILLMALLSVTPRKEPSPAAA